MVNLMQPGDGPPLQPPHALATFIAFLQQQQAQQARQQGGVTEAPPITGPAPDRDGLHLDPRGGQASEQRLFPQAPPLPQKSVLDRTREIIGTVGNSPQARRFGLFDPPPERVRSVGGGGGDSGRGQMPMPNPGGVAGAPPVWQNPGNPPSVISPPADPYIREGIESVVDAIPGLVDRFFSVRGASSPVPIPRSDMFAYPPGGAELFGDQPLMPQQPPPDGLFGAPPNMAPTAPGYPRVGMAGPPLQQGQQPQQQSPPVPPHPRVSAPGRQAGNQGGMQVAQRVGQQTQGSGQGGGQGGGAQQPPAQPQQGGWNQDAWQALLRAGLSTMQAGGQPGATTLGALGQGGIAGLDAYQQQQAARAKTQAETARQQQEDMFRRRDLEIKQQVANANTATSLANATTAQGRLALDDWKARNPKMQIINEGGQIVGVNPITGQQVPITNLDGLTTKQRYDLALEMAKMNATSKAPVVDPFTGETKSVETFDPAIYQRQVMTQMESMGLDATAWRKGYEQKTQQYDAEVERVNAAFEADAAKMRAAGRSEQEIMDREAEYRQYLSNVRQQMLSH